MFTDSLGISQTLRFFHASLYFGWCLTVTDEYTFSYLRLSVGGGFIVYCPNFVIWHVFLLAIGSSVVALSGFSAKLASLHADLSTSLGVSSRVADPERTLESFRLLVCLWHMLPPVVSGTIIAFAEKMDIRTCKDCNESVVVMPYAESIICCSYPIFWDRQYGYRKQKLWLVHCVGCAIQERFVAQFEMRSTTLWHGQKGFACS